MQKIRLAIVSNGITPYRLNLHSRLSRECQEIELWSLFTHEISNAPWNIPVPTEIRPVYFGSGESALHQSLLHRPLHGVVKGLRILEWLTEHRIDAVILFGYNDLSLLLLAWWCKRNGKPCYLFGDCNADCDVPSLLKGMIKRRLLPTILRGFTAVMHCGTKGVEYFLRYGVPQDRLFPFPYEPDYERIQAAGNLPSTRRRLLYCGRLIAIKRVDILLNAFQRIADVRGEWDLVIAGDGPLRSRLMEQVKPSLRRRVQFLGFINDGQKLAELYSNCDALVLPSDYEPWGVVVAEAAVRLAVVCSSRVGAAVDLVQDHVNGRIFGVGDVDALTEALLEVTDYAHIDSMKSASPGILAKWRQGHDPIEGLRRALKFAGLPFQPGI
jgi:glycosyltransferase involved in cell wall biosynthesis